MHFNTVVLHSKIKWKFKFRSSGVARYGWDYISTSSCLSVIYCNSGANWTPCCCAIITRSCSMRMFLSIWWLFFSVIDISYLSGELHCLLSLQGGKGAVGRELCRNESNRTLKKDEGEEGSTFVATYTVPHNRVTRSYTKCHTCNMHVTCTGQEKTCAMQQTCLV